MQGVSHVLKLRYIYHGGGTSGGMSVWRLPDRQDMPPLGASLDATSASETHAVPAPVQLPQQRLTKVCCAVWELYTLPDEDYQTLARIPAPSLMRIASASLAVSVMSQIQGFPRIVKLGPAQLVKSIRL